MKGYDLKSENEKIKELFTFNNRCCELNIDYMNRKEIYQIFNRCNLFYEKDAQCTFTTNDSTLKESNLLGLINSSNGEAGKSYKLESLEFKTFIKNTSS
jgi:hypothetical protein